MKKILAKINNSFRNRSRHAIGRASIFYFKIGPWMLFVYLYLIFRFPDFWYVIVFLFFIHCNFSNDLQERVNKYSSLFTIIAVLIVIGTYFSDKRDLNRDITAALNIENRNNQIAIESIKSMEE